MNSIMNFNVQLIIVFSYIFRVSTLRLIMFDIPSPVIQGDSIELTCSYDLGNDKLYSIKWYKNDVEFYRYVPSDWPPGQFLPLKGINVDLSRSTRNSVYLKTVDINSSGLYRCEVSAEAPTFVTGELEKQMKVYALPADGPHISISQDTFKEYYNIGDKLSLNCSSYQSKPAAALEWFINDQQVNENEVNTMYYKLSTLNGLETSILSLDMIVMEGHVKSKMIKLRCTSRISNIYTMSNEICLFVQNKDYYKFSFSENLSQVRSMCPLNGISLVLTYFMMFIAIMV